MPFIFSVDGPIELISKEFLVFQGYDHMLLCVVWQIKDLTPNLGILEWLLKQLRFCLALLDSSPVSSSSPISSSTSKHEVMFTASLSKTLTGKNPSSIARLANPFSYKIGDSELPN